MSLFDFLQSSSCHLWHQPPLIFTCAASPCLHSPSIIVLVSWHSCSTNSPVTVQLLNLAGRKFRSVFLSLWGTAVKRWTPANPCKRTKKKKKKGNVLRPSAGNMRRLVNTFHVTTMATAAQSRSAVTSAPACRHFGLINSSELNRRSGRRFNNPVVETKRQ